MPQDSIDKELLEKIYQETTNTLENVLLDETKSIEVRARTLPILLLGSQMDSELLSSIKTITQNNYYIKTVEEFLPNHKLNLLQKERFFINKVELIIAIAGNTPGIVTELTMIACKKELQDKTILFVDKNKFENGELGTLPELFPLLEVSYYRNNEEALTLVLESIKKRTYRIAFNSLMSNRG